MKATAERRPRRDLNTPAASRVLVVWCPDWPVVAAVVSEGHPPGAPIAVLAAGRVLACSPQARVDGVRRGLRRREAQGRCPELIVVNQDPARDVRAFEPVVTAVEAIAPGVAVLRPGACAIAVRGPARYFGGEQRAAERMVDHVAEACGVECQVGVADGIFTAFHAARAGVVVDPGHSAEFLAPLDVAALERPELVDILRRLGIRTLGEFAGLPEADVLTRFGEDAAMAHRFARGLDPRPLAARTPPPDLDAVMELDPPADRVDAAVFATRTLGETLHQRLAGHGLACTQLLIEARTEHGEELTRQWRHDGALSAADIADRVRWQLDGWLSGTSIGVRRRPPKISIIGGSGGSGLVEEHPEGRPTAGITRLRLVPDGVVAQSGMQLGLWGDAGQGRERAHRALSRVQGLLGPEAVLTAVPSGGRGTADLVRLVAWGDERSPDRPPGRPWPGRIPEPAPALVYPEPLPALVYGPDAGSVGVTGRHLMTAPLCRVVVGLSETTHESLLRRVASEGPRGGSPVDVTSWAGPWPVEERWWAPAEAQRRARFQVCLADGRALLLALSGGRWWVEAVYD
ncbi:MAG: DNA polymerase Y family protein [Micromonosporaceae bacterium]